MSAATVRASFSSLASALGKASIVKNWKRRVRARGTGGSRSGGLKTSLKSMRRSRWLVWIEASGNLNLSEYRVNGGDEAKGVFEN